MLVVEWHDPIVQQVGRGERGLAIVELGEGNLRVGVDEGLLIDAPDALECPDIVRILGAEIAWVLGLDLAVGFFFLLSSTLSNFGL